MLCQKHRWQLEAQVSETWARWWSAKHQLPMTAPLQAARLDDSYDVRMSMGATLQDKTIIRHSPPECPVHPSAATLLRFRPKHWHSCGASFRCAAST
jgi:hypothetical protein